MSKQSGCVIAAVETLTLPTYPFPEAEEMPMFAETANHQGTTGNPYPCRVVSEVDTEHRTDKDWTVIRLENDYIRLLIIPALGGRIFEAYDKTTGYDFLYRQHVIKPALIGAYGSWISGGMEFNWPFHHRPSTVMPVDHAIERGEDGSVTVWLSEHAPNDRTKGMVGIVLRPDRSYFETRVQITNRTPVRRNFLWWENAAVAIHEEYRLVFPPDVTWVHHHNDRHHTTFPIASGQYGADSFTEPTDISLHGMSRLSTSYFAAPSKYDFFGGYDQRRECGVLHIADHHISPGKKMFTWGYGTNASNWEKKLTDTDGQYAELMAGAYTDDQPDFTWIAPYETKTFSQFWYPTEGIGYTSFATVDGAAALDREKGKIRFNVTGEYDKVTVTVKGEDGRVLLDSSAPMRPSAVTEFDLKYPEGEKLSVRAVSDRGLVLIDYTEEEHDTLHIPGDNKGIPLPDKLKTACELVTAGQHIDQYRDPLYKPDIYYLEALRREPDFLPALKALGEYYTRILRYEDALKFLNKAWDIECRYNQNPEDGSVGYHKGICLMRLGRPDEAYDALCRAAWSNNVISPAMTLIAAIDGTRGDYGKMFEHAMAAVDKESRHPLALPYASLALYRLGDNMNAAKLCRYALGLDPLNHLARFVLATVTGKGKKAFYGSLESDPAQTVLDLAFDLLDAGFTDETVSLITGVLPIAKNTAMLLYTLAYCLEKSGDASRAARRRRLAGKDRIVDVFPMRAGERDVLRSALTADPKDGFAAYLLGCLEYSCEDYGTAAALWEQSVKTLPGFYITYRNLALAYFNHLGREKEALPLMRRAVELKPKDAALLCETATVMQKLGVDGNESAAYLEANKPDEPNDQIILAIARAYNYAGDFDKAEKVMLSHVFSPSEGAEVATADPYMFACFSRGRRAMKEGRYSDALADFDRAAELPENLNVGFWNDSVKIPYRCYQAAALDKLGRTDEARAIIDSIVSMKDVGMWNMGGEFVYYSALASRLGGKEQAAQKIMRDAVLSWEKELADGCTYHRVIGSLYNCFIGDGTRNRLAALYGMLGYGALYNGDTEKARKLFGDSLALDPSAKIAVETALL